MALDAGRTFFWIDGNAAFAAEELVHAWNLVFAIQNLKVREK